MSLQEIDPYDELSNPLDSVEDILAANEWAFSRHNEDELNVQITGRHGAVYNMHFFWQEEYGAMQFTCRLDDIEFPAEQLGAAAQAMRKINAGLWLGHFDFHEEQRVPRFRHTCLFRGMHGASGAEHIEDLVDIALSECERFFPAFDLLARPKDHDDAVFALAMMDSAGES